MAIAFAKGRPSHWFFVVAAGALGCAIGLITARASGQLSSGFAYSGVLKNQGLPVDGSHAFAFDLVDGNNTPVGCPTDSRASLTVTSGRFDAPNLFSSCGNLSSILQSQGNLAVRITVDGQVLSPNQVLGAVPYALRAVNADSGGSSGSTVVVPPTVAWPGALYTGNSQCALNKGVCTEAFNSGGSSIGCATSTTGGSASCAQSAGINASASWSSGMNYSGNAACAAQVATCVQAYSSQGQPITCDAITTGGIAACSKNTASQGFDQSATWSTSRSGRMACALVNAECTAAFNASGGPVDCSVYVGAGSARCLTRQLGDSWDFSRTWTSGVVLGLQECAEHGGVCVEVLRGSDSLVSSCDVSRGSSGGEVVVAKCRTRTAADGWDFTTSWASGVFSGNVRCTQQGGVCVAVYRGSDQTISDCATGRGGGTDPPQVTALCRNRTAADPWNLTSEWTSGVFSGYVKCTLADAECVDVLRSSDGLVSDCATGRGVSNSEPVVARCRSRTANDNWNSFVQWTSGTFTGTERCSTVLGKACVGVYRSSDGLVSDCASQRGASGSDPVVARCR